MAILYLMLSTFTIFIYLLEWAEEIDADSKFENEKVIGTFYFSPKILFYVPFSAIKKVKTGNLEFLQRFSNI
jgi:hypothetical protein